MANDLVNFNPEDMMQEYIMLKAELDRYDTLYATINREIEESKGKSRTPYVYMSSQYSTLTSILSARQTIISKLFDMKRVVEDFKFRYLKLATDDKESGPNNQMVIRELIKALSDKSIPYEDLAAINQVEDEVPTGYGSIDDISAALDAQFYSDDEGILRSVEETPTPDREEEAREEAFDSATLDDIEYATLVATMDAKMKAYQLLVTNHPEGDLAIVQEINYEDEIIYVEYDVDQLEKDDRALLDFIDNEDNFDVDDEGSLLVPEGFTSYIVNALS